jgi:uncharacterized protein (TIGR02284 family)
MIDSLNKLLKLNLDAAEGYEYAAENIKNDNFKNFLKSYALRRKRYAEELRKNILSMGGEPDRSNGTVGEVHQAFMDLRKSVNSDNDQDSALLQECVRGEGEALIQYEKLLKSTDLIPDLRRKLIIHFDKIRAARSTMDELDRVV